MAYGERRRELGFFSVEKVKEGTVGFHWIMADCRRYQVGGSVNLPEGRGGPAEGPGRDGLMGRGQWGEVQHG